MIKCPKCGEENRDYDRYCLNCGNSLKKEVEYKQRVKEYEKQRKLEKEQIEKQKELDKSKTYRDYNRRYTRKTSKNIKTINQGKISRQKFTTRIKNDIKGLFSKEFHTLPIILTMLFPGLGFTYYGKWMKAIFFLIVTVILALYIIPLSFGRVIYVIYWVIMLLLTHNEA